MTLVWNGNLSDVGKLFAVAPKSEAIGWKAGSTALHIRQTDGASLAVELGQTIIIRDGRLELL